MKMYKRDGQKQRRGLTWRGNEWPNGLMMMTTENNTDTEEDATNESESW